MDRAQCAVAILHRVRDDADCEQVVNLIHRDALAQQLLVNRVEPLDAPINADRIHSIFIELQPNQFHGFFEERLPAFATLFD